MEWLAALDGGILLWIQEFLRGGILEPVVKLYTHFGDHGLGWIALCLMLLCIPKTRKAGLLGLLSLALGALCTNVVLKHLVARPRPWLEVEGLTYLVVERDPNSFPSGHTCAAFAAASAWWHTLPRRWMGAAALVMAALMGFSRLYVGVHYPTDVLAGAVIGFACGQVVWLVWKKARERRGLAV